MKLIIAYLLKRELYHRYTTFQKKKESRKTRLMYAKYYMDKLSNFPSVQSCDFVYDILKLKPGKSSYKLVMKIYSMNDVSGMEKELPL